MLAESGDSPSVGSPPGSTFSNSEALPLFERELVGSLPVVGILLFVAALFALAWLAEPENPFLLGLVVVIGGLAVASTAYAWSAMCRQIPTTVEIGNSGVRARWSGRRSRSLEVPFGVIRSVEAARWRWIHSGRANFARYTASALCFDPADVAGSAELPGAASGEGVLYLTLPNADRVRGALSSWRATRGREPEEIRSSVLTEAEAGALGEV